MNKKKVFIYLIFVGVVSCDKTINLHIKLIFISNDELFICIIN